MSQIFFNVLPVFMMILVGWLLVRSGYLTSGVGDALGDFVFRVAVPMMLFKTMAVADAHGASPIRLWLAYFAGVAITWTLAHLVATRLFGRDRRIGVLSGVSAAFANNVFIGLPLVSRLVGDNGVVALSVLLAIHLPVMMVAGTVLMERATARETGVAATGIGAVLRQVGRNLVTNPLVVGIACGLVLRLTGIGLSGMPLILADQISMLAGPVALISLGMAAHTYGVAGNLGLASAMGGLKLFCLPACVWVFCHLFGLSPDWTAAMVITSAVPTGVNAWLIANRFQVGQGLAATTITMTTAFGFLSVSFWVWLMAP